VKAAGGGMDLASGRRLRLYPNIQTLNRRANTAASRAAGHNQRCFYPTAHDASCLFR
jgi:hypothetical protein